MNENNSLISKTWEYMGLPFFVQPFIVSSNDSLLLGIGNHLHFLKTVHMMLFK